MDSKKIVFIAGGLPHYFIPVLNRINAIPGYSVEIIIPMQKSATVGKAVHQEIKGNNFAVHHLPEKKQWYGKPSFSDLTAALEKIKPNALFPVWPYSLAFILDAPLRRHIKNNKIKIVNRDIPFQVPLYNETENFYRKTPPVDENLQVILDYKGLKNKLYITFLKRLRRRLYRSFDAHALYAESGRKVIHSYGVPPEKIFVLGNTIDTDRLLAIDQKIKPEELPFPYHPYRLVHVGRLVKWKKVDLLLRALKQLTDEFPQAEAVIIGNGPEKESLVALAQQLGISSHVKFIDGIYNEELLGRYLRSASIYVLAGMGGLSINEAMCFGKPIIISTCDGTETMIVKDGENGFYFRDDSAEDLAEKIKYLFRRPAAIEEFGKRSKAIIETEMNIHTVTERYKQLFEYLFVAVHDLE